LDKPYLKSIGGYFGLDLNNIGYLKKSSFILLNSARNCLELVLNKLKPQYILSPIEQWYMDMIHYNMGKYCWGKVLDFGCGNGSFKEHYGGDKVINYDIVRVISITDHKLFHKVRAHYQICKIDASGNKSVYPGGGGTIELGDSLVSGVYSGDYTDNIIGMDDSGVENYLLDKVAEQDDLGSGTKSNA